MKNPLWVTLPGQVRAEVDALVMEGHKLQAVQVVREALKEPRPGIYECMDLVAERFADLGQRFTRSPTAPLDLDELTAEIQALPHEPAAIEALWDGDSEGWMVRLLAVTIEPRTEHHLATVQHGTDIRLFNGEVPPWPEALEASTVGRRLAERLGIPFYFASPRRRTTSPRAGGTRSDQTHRSPSRVLVGSNYPDSVRGQARPGPVVSQLTP